VFILYSIQVSLDNLAKNGTCFKENLNYVGNITISTQTNQVRPIIWLMPHKHNSSTLNTMQVARSCIGILVKNSIYNVIVMSIIIFFTGQTIKSLKES
jgi:hypothetical protein